MTKLNPYLNFPGNTEDAFEFYRSVFGGEFAALMRWKDLPDGPAVPAENADKILHIALPIGDCMLMGTDAVDGTGEPLDMGNNVHISIHPESKAEATRLYDGLATDGTVTMPMQDMFWGAYFGMLTDRFGVQWMVNYDYCRKGADDEREDR